MSANIKVSGKVYSGIETISVKDTNDVQVNFLLQGATPPPAPVYKENDVTFIDYDGSVVISYTKTEFLALSVMPANPTHTGLIAEGWNWTLADAKSYVTTYGTLNIGQMYHTASGKTEYDIQVNEATGFTATLGGTNGTEKDWGDGTIDTLETHTYATSGNYTIKLSGTFLPVVQNSKKLLACRIASGVTSIFEYAFYNCKSLRSVIIPSSVTSILSDAFYVCVSLQSVTISNSVTNIPNYSFSNCYSLQSVVIPNSITSIGKYVFAQCYSLQSIIIPSSVTTIGSSTFSLCHSLRSVTIPSGITSIAEYMFNSCYSLQSIIIPSSVTTIEQNVFSNCQSLQSVTVPSSVISIANSAFSACIWLTIVTILAMTPPTVSSYSFPSAVTKIYIPHGTLATYQADTNWSSYVSKLVELPA